VYFVTDPDYGLYMDEQQRLNLQLLRELAALGVRFAFPRRMVYLAQGAGQPSATASNHQFVPTGAAEA